MTLFAGIFSRRPDQPISKSVCDELRRVISRDPTDHVLTFQDSRCFLVKVDIGAFGEEAFVIGGGSATVIAGEPLLDDGNNGPSRHRTHDVNRLHVSWIDGDWTDLKIARGAFCGAHYQASSHQLSLIADKLAIRPLYYWMDEDFVIFATALRVLESLEVVPKSMDLRGVTELAALGYSLGRRTPYVGISLLHAAEIVQFEEKSTNRLRYWSWDDIEPSQRSENETLRDTHSAFMRAVSLRQRDDKLTTAYLSGGLDSRCAVAALLDLGAQVHTFNFALPGTQDFIYGNEFASRAGTFHEAVSKDHGDLTPDYSTLMARACAESDRQLTRRADRIGLVWSGEGGSVAFGHVHLSPEIVARMRAGEVDKAIETYLSDEHASVARRLLHSNVSDMLARMLSDGIREELASIKCADPGRSFYLFLMLNDQRRKLSDHFENIDLHRLEFQLPFFDSEFLACVMSLPLDACLRHKFYTKWLKMFSPVVTEVPWQAYPNHEPCPITAPEGAAYQWDDVYQADQNSVMKRNLITQSSEMLHAKDFPRVILKKTYLRIATMCYRYGLRDYSYVIQSAWKYYSYWKNCQGRFSPLSNKRNDGYIQSDPDNYGYGGKVELTSSVLK